MSAGGLSAAEGRGADISSVADAQTEGNEAGCMSKC
jgi:hypothetical protein